MRNKLHSYFFLIILFFTLGINVKSQEVWCLKKDYSNIRVKCALDSIEKNKKDINKVELLDIEELLKDSSICNFKLVDYAIESFVIDSTKMKIGNSICEVCEIIKEQSNRYITTSYISKYGNYYVIIHIDLNTGSIHSITYIFEKQK